MNLFSGYEVVSDWTFVTYMARRCNDYDDGKDIMPDALMTQALNKYKTLCKAYKWNALSPDQEKIVALSSQVQKL